MKELLRLISIPFIFKTINTALLHYGKAKRESQQNTQQPSQVRAQSLDFGNKSASCSWQRESLQSWKQRQLTRWDKYGKWGKAWHKWFPIQEKTPQCISSRHLTQSSPSLPHPKASSQTTLLFVPKPVCVREEAGDGGRRRKRRIMCTFVFLPKHTPTHTHTNSLKCWCHWFWPHHHFAYCGNLPWVNWLGLSWFFVCLFVLFLFRFVFFLRDYFRFR